MAPAARARPAWAVKPVAPPVNNEDEDLFNQTSRTNLELEDRARKLKHEKSKKPETKNTADTESDGSPEGRKSKKRRISKDESPDNAESEEDVTIENREGLTRASPGVKQSVEPESRFRESSTPIREKPPKSRESVKPSPARKKAAPIIVDIDSSDSDEDDLRSKSKALEPTQKPTTANKPGTERPPSSQQPSTDSVHARSMSRDHAISHEPSIPKSPSIDIPKPAKSPLRSSHALTASPEKPRFTSTNPSTKPKATTPVPPAPDPQIQVFLHSRIPNTTPLIATIRLSQPLSCLRRSWCSRQTQYSDAADDFLRSTFLIWRRRRLFDTTSCRSLGVGVNERTGKPFLKNASGEIVTPGSGGDDKVDGISEGEDGKLQLEMEAVNEEIWQRDRRERERERERREKERTGEVAVGLPVDGGSGATESTVDGEKADKLPENKQNGIRIVLKARGHEDYKLKVKPTTKFAQITRAFRTQRKIPEGAHVFLMFEGERLSEEDAMMDTDIDDLEEVEVHVK
ncbi:MAG: hypothetical protein M1831_003832 [Alyxoria varia]|nr:MAG: hypothetical protein M1831_003832 [Alyxoria varia]